MQRCEKLPYRERCDRFDLNSRPQALSFACTPAIHVPNQGGLAEPCRIKGTMLNLNLRCFYFQVKCTIRTVALP